MLDPDLCSVLALLAIALCWIWSGRPSSLRLPNDFQTPARQRWLRRMQEARR